MAFKYGWFVGGPILVALLLAPLSAYLQTTPSAPPAKNEEKTDSSLSRSVHHQLQQLPFYSVFDFLTYSIDGGKVTLAGQVQRPTLKSGAEAAVKSLEGVSSVANNIEVLPALPSDHEVGRNVYRAIFENGVLQKYAVETVPSIHIIVKNGAVSLEGAVDSEADKALAGSLAGKVPKVVGLKNNLLVRNRAIPAK